MTGNRNFMVDSSTGEFYFLRCPRSFLKTDMPAKKPRKDCPFRSHFVKNGEGCLLPTGLFYAERKLRRSIKFDAFDTPVCYLCGGGEE